MFDNLASKSWIPSSFLCSCCYDPMGKDPPDSKMPKTLFATSASKSSPSDDQKVVLSAPENRSSFDQESKAILLGLHANAVAKGWTDSWQSRRLVGGMPASLAVICNIGSLVCNSPAALASASASLCFAAAAHHVAPISSSNFTTDAKF